VALPVAGLLQVFSARRYRSITVAAK